MSDSPDRKHAYVKLNGVHFSTVEVYRHDQVKEEETNWGNWIVHYCTGAYQLCKHVAYVTEQTRYIVPLESSWYNTVSHTCSWHALNFWDSLTDVHQKHRQRAPLFLISNRTWTEPIIMTTNKCNLIWRQPTKRTFFVSRKYKFNSIFLIFDISQPFGHDSNYKFI